MELVKIAGPLILAFIMLSLGLGLKIENFKRVLIQPKDFLIGFISQVIFFPLVALVLALIFPLPLELKVGLLLLAIAPGGVTTNIISKYANGDVALSISLTAVISLLCFITIPVVFSITYPFLTVSDLPFNYSIGSIIIQIFLITTVPVIIGMILKAIFPNFFSKTEKIFVNISFALFLLFLFLAIYQEFENIAGYFASSGIVTLVLNIAVVLIAFILCNLFNIQKPQKKTIIIEPTKYAGKCL